MEKELFYIIDKHRGYLPPQQQVEMGITCVATNNSQMLRQIASSTNVEGQFEQVIEQLPYSKLTKEKLQQNVKRFMEKGATGNLIDILLDYAKLLESNEPKRVFDMLVDMIDEKTGLMKPSEQQSKIVKSYFNIQKGQRLFSGRIGTGFGITDLLGDAKETAIYGQDFALDDMVIGDIRLHLYDYSNVQLKVGNILTTPAFAEQKFDYIYDTPRFGYKPVGIDMDQLKSDSRYSYYGVPSKMNADLGYVVAGIDMLNETGKGAFYLTTGALSRSGADEKIRERLVSNDIIEAVIEFPGGFHAPVTAISSVLVLVNKAKAAQAKNKVLFINATALSETVRKKAILTVQGLNEIYTILSEQKEVKGISKMIDTAELHDYELVPSRYVFENEMELDMYGTVEVDLQALEKVPTVPLRKIANIFRGYNALPKDEKVNGNVAMLKIADIVDGEIEEERLTRYELGGRVKIDNYRLQQGDIVLSIRGQLKVALFDSERDDVLLSQNFIGIRCNKNFDPAFVKLYLESPTMQFIMHNKLTGSTVLNLPTKDIEDFMIPVLPLEQQQRIVAEYEQQQAKLKEQLEEILSKLKEAKLNAFKDMGIKETFRLK